MKLKFVSLFVFLAIFSLTAFGQRPAHSIEFDESTHNFGELKQGDPATFNFVFKNTSEGPVTLKNVKASCGCTTPKWPREAVAPGEKGEIAVTYNSQRVGPFNKSVRITYNDRTDPMTIFIKGTVKAKENNLPATAVSNPAKPAINYGVPRGAVAFEKMIENLRTVTSQEKKEVVFRFKNTSTRPVTILTEKTETDPEVTLVPKDKVIAPGQESTLKILLNGEEMKKQNQADGYFSKRVVFFTDEAQNGRKQLSINGNFKRIFTEAEKKSAPAIKFETLSVNGGKLIEGEKFVYDYKFTNTGNGPLRLASVKASCGCTTPSWPKDKEIKPGESEIITVSFNSKGRMGKQSKSVTVKSNVIDNPTSVLKFSVEVVKDPFHAGSMMGGSK